MKKYFLSSLIFVFFSSSSFTQINLAQANQLADFVVINSDSCYLEGDAKAFKIFLPKENFIVQVSFIENKRLTLELFSKRNGDYWSIFLNLPSYDGNIYKNLYAMKYLPKNRQVNEKELNLLIQKLNISSNQLITQQNEFDALVKKLEEFLDIPRDFEEYEKITNNTIWDSNYLCPICYKYDKNLMLFNPSLENLKNISKVYLE